MNVRMMTVGKVRGLQQIASPDGIFTMCAMDQRGSMRSMIDPKDPERVSYDQMAQRKFELCSILSQYASAVLLDPIYGAAQCISRGAIYRSTGLLVAIEATGYSGDKEHRVTELLDSWSVEKIKRMGASAVKLLVYYRPDLKDAARKQLEVIARVGQDCTRYDIPFLVEPVSYAIGEETKDPARFAAIKPELVIQTARDITALPVDVLKAEFPADLKYERDEKKLLDLCRRLDAATPVPWVILSAGVDFDFFESQVKIACRAGASGFLGGRAIWKEAISMPDAEERLAFLRSVGVLRLKKLAETAANFGTPWYKKLGLAPGGLARVSEKWYLEY